MNARHTSFAFVCAALGGLALGACFTGLESRGLPCTADSHCGPKQQCIDGYCGGVFACPEGTEIPLESVCDGVFDCENGNDEHPDVCDTDAFFCDDGTTIPLDQTCDQVPQCPDGSDELPELCLLDDCSDPAEAYAFTEVMPLQGFEQPLGVFVANFVSDSPAEFIAAGDGGLSIKLFTFGAMGPADVELPGDVEVNTGPEFTSAIVEVLPVDFDGDGLDDLIVRTIDHRLFGYGGVDSGTPAQLFFTDAMGTSQPFFQMPFPIVDIAAGKLNDDSFIDIVVLTEGGAIITALGNPNSLDSDEPPFTISLMDAVIVPDAVRIDVVDIDEMDLDELLVVRDANGTPSLRVGRAKAGGTVADFWEFGADGPLPFVPDELLAGRIDMVGGLDLAMLGGNGDVAVLLQVEPGMFGAPHIANLGAPTSGLTLADFDCSNTQDLVVNVENPPSVRVLFASNMGEIDTSRSLTIESAGLPRGKVGVLQLDADSSWDVFHAIEPGTTVTQEQIRGFLSGELEGP